MPEQPPTPGYDKDRWMRALEAMAVSLGKDGPPVKLCLIGSAACLFAGMELRTTVDLDIWQPSSDFDIAELKHAATQAGLLFNPTDFLEDDQPYLQLVEAGIVHVGPFEPITMFRIGRLVISRPPVENIIASKLLRCESKDLEDIQFIQKHFEADPARIKAVIAKFPPSKRQTAEENLIYLEIFS